MEVIHKRLQLARDSAARRVLPQHGWDEAVGMLLLCSVRGPSPCREVRKERNLCLSLEMMWLYRKPQRLDKKPLELSESNRFTGYEHMYTKSLAVYVLVTSSWKYILVTVASKDMKSLGIDEHMCKICPLKTIRCCWENLKITVT